MKKAIVLMPVYNAAPYLREAIDSILSQSYSDFEFVIVDDGSTDGSADIIRSYNDPRIRLLQNSENRGICYSLNRGINESESEYIIRMDADDISMPRRIEWQIRFMDKNPDVGASGGNLMIFGEDVKEYPFVMNHNKYESRAELLFSSSMAHPATIIRRSVIDANDLRYKEEYRGIEDFELWWQIAKHAFIVNQDKTLLRYRVHKSQVTATDKEEINTLADRFAAERFAALGANLTADEARAVRLYSTGLKAKMNISEVSAFVNAILKAINADNPGRQQLRAYRKLCSLAILSLVNSLKMSDENWRLCIDYARECGVMPLDIYYKILLRRLLKR